VIPVSPEVIRILKETLPATIIATIGELVAGAFLGNMTNIFRMFPGLMILVPSILDLRGCLSTALSSRLGTALHLGVIGKELGFNDELKENLIAPLINSVMLSTILGIIAYFVSSQLNVEGIGLFTFVFISLLASVMATLFQMSITVYFAFTAQEKGLDPDNVTIPALASLGDIIGIISLYIATIIIMSIGGVFIG